MTSNYRSYRPIQIPPQREQKGYDIWTEVIIPAIQALIVAWLCDVVGGLALYLIVYIGPATISTVLGGLILLGTCWIVGFSRINYQAKAPATMVGVLVFAVQQHTFVRLAAVWPWAWKDPLQMWNAWVHTLWIGPLVGGGVLIWRFVNEIFDPFWPRLKEYPEPEKQKRQPALASSKMVITRYPDKKVVEEEPPELEEVWATPEEGYTFKEHLRSFLIACDRKGTGRKDWLPAGEKYHLSTGLCVTRGKYDDMLRVLRGIGIYRHREGVGLERLCTLQEAIALVEEQIDD